MGHESYRMTTIVFWEFERPWGVNFWQGWGWISENIQSGFVFTKQKWRLKRHLSLEGYTFISVPRELKCWVDTCWVGDIVAGQIRNHVFFKRTIPVHYQHRTTLNESINPCWANWYWYTSCHFASLDDFKTVIKNSYVFENWFPTHFGRITDFLKFP